MPSRSQVRWPAGAALPRPDARPAQPRPDGGPVLGLRHLHPCLPGGRADRRDEQPGPRRDRPGPRHQPAQSADQRHRPAGPARRPAGTAGQLRPAQPGAALDGGEAARRPSPRAARAVRTSHLRNAVAEAGRPDGAPRRRGPGAHRRVLPRLRGQRLRARGGRGRGGDPGAQRLHGGGTEAGVLRAALHQQRAVRRGAHQGPPQPRIARRPCARRRADRGHLDLVHARAQGRVPRDVGPRRCRRARGRQRHLGHLRAARRPPRPRRARHRVRADARDAALPPALPAEVARHRDAGDGPLRPGARPAGGGLGPRLLRRGRHVRAQGRALADRAGRGRAALRRDSEGAAPREDARRGRRRATRRPAAGRSEQSSGVRTRHPVEILAEAYPARRRLMPSGDEPLAARSSEPSPT